MKKILLIILILFMTGCATNKVKTATSVSEFENLGLSKGFVTGDSNNSYDTVNYITEYGKLTKDDITIEMIVYENSDQANTVLESHIESFDLLKSTGAQVKKRKGKNYYHYDMVSNGRYMVSSRVDNTLIFAKVLLKDKNTVDEILNELGY